MHVDHLDCFAVEFVCVGAIGKVPYNNVACGEWHVSEQVRSGVIAHRHSKGENGYTERQTHTHRERERERENIDKEKETWNNSAKFEASKREDSNVVSYRQLCR